MNIFLFLYMRLFVKYFLFILLLQGCSLGTDLRLYNNTSKDIIVKVNGLIMEAEEDGNEFSANMPMTENVVMSIIIGNIENKYNISIIPQEYREMRFLKDIVFLQLQPDRKLYILMPMRDKPFEKNYIQPNGFPLLGL